MLERIEALADELNNALAEVEKYEDDFPGAIATYLDDAVDNGAFEADPTREPREFITFISGANFSVEDGRLVADPAHGDPVVWNPETESWEDFEEGPEDA